MIGDHCHDDHDDVEVDDDDVDDDVDEPIIMVKTDINSNQWVNGSSKSMLKEQMGRHLCKHSNQEDDCPL